MPNRQSNQPKILECVNCHKRTTETEAADRNIKTGFCGYCGYGLEPVPNQPEPSLEALLDELEDAIWCSRGDDITQNTAAKNRAIKARADMLHRIQADKEAAEGVSILLKSDLAWCLGKLRGLGHPSEMLEARHGLTHPQAGEPDHLTQVSLCPTCNSVTHTHDGICTRCGEPKAAEPVADPSQIMVPEFRDHGNEGEGK